MVVSAKVGYVAVFSLAAVGCFVGVARARTLENTDVKRGLIALLLLAGVWAALTAGRLLTGTAAVSVVLYMVGLVVGFATVGAWLYFCSAYAGKRYHRQPLARQTALALFLLISGIKLTNPLHGLYFTTMAASMPFSHVAIQLQPVHWLVTGLAYILSAIGFYMLYEVFRESTYDTTSLGGLVMLTGLPVGLDLLGYLTPPIVLKLNYEPLGVAVFALGALYIVEEKFSAIAALGRQEVVGYIDEPVVVVDYNGQLRDINPAARQAFPAIDGALGEPIAEQAPELTQPLAGEPLTVDAEPPRYYLRDETPLTFGATTIGLAFVFTDVTELESQRRELTRQNDQLNNFEEAITHELRNTLAIIQGHAELAHDTLAESANPTATDALETIDATADRTLRIVNDLAMLARQGQTLDTVDDCAFRPAVEQAWADTDTGSMQLVTEGEGQVTAEKGRLVALYSEAFEFARLTGSSTVTVALLPEVLQIQLDGVHINADMAADAFRYGSAVPTAEAGMALPNVQTLARVHGWEAHLDPDYTAGTRVVISDVATTQQSVPNE